MNLPLTRWLIFGVSLLILLAAMGWTTSSLLVMEQKNHASVQEAEIQERVRLALWRMDSAVSALMIRENSRPPVHYRAFHEADQAYNKSYQMVKKGEVLTPSPLLTEQPEHVFLYFEQSDPTGLTSPQLPSGNQLDIAESYYIEPAQTKPAALRLEKLKSWLPGLVAAADKHCGQAEITGFVKLDPLTSKQQQTAQTVGNLFYNSQVDRNNAEWISRGRVANRYTKDTPTGAKLKSAAPAVISKEVIPPNEPVESTPFAAVWAPDNELVLLRQTSANEKPALQGVWIDWASLRDELLLEAADLFPNAVLKPVQPVSGLTNDPTRLASIPAQLVTGPTPAEIAIGFLGTPLRRSLLVAWICILAAAAAVAALMHGAISLSERRGAFVSAVTHELRTPLTTFQLYTDLMADGNPNQETRANYLNTLRGEAERLGHLVENVLAYARLERGSANPECSQITLGELIEKVQDCLQRRANQADMQLVIDVPDEVKSNSVRVNVDSVERILFNLIDNACKYATPEAEGDRRIHLEADTSGPIARLRVRDHGRGIEQTEMKRLFRPFQKSATDAAHSAPGVGLGLALCQKMSRSLGGELRLEPASGSGASFVLELPAV